MLCWSGVLNAPEGLEHLVHYQTFQCLKRTHIPCRNRRFTDRQPVSSHMIILTRLTPEALDTPRIPSHKMTSLTLTLHFYIPYP